MKYILGIVLCIVLVAVSIEGKRTKEPSSRTPRPPTSPRPSRTPRPSRPTRPTRQPPTRCESSFDCKQNECCLTHDTLFSNGICLNLAEEGKRCSLDENTLKGKYLHSCPCVEGLSCVAEKIKTIPFVGEVRINERCKSDDSTTEQPEVSNTELPKTSASVE